MSTTWAGFDIALLLLGMIAYVVAIVMHVRARYVIPCVTGAVVLYGAWVLARDPKGPDYVAMGYRLDNLIDCLRWLGPLTLLSAAAMVGYGWWTQRAIWSRRILSVLPLYLVWALVQQTVFQGILNRRLQELLDRPWAVPLVVGLLFSAVHLPRWWLVLLTAVAGPIWAAIYLVTPNLYLLAVSHAILGAVAYFCVQGEDPLEEI